MDPVAAMTPLEVIMKYPGPWLAWILPMIGALSMPLFERLGHKIRDYAAVAWGFTSVVSAASMIPWLFSGNYPGDIKLTTWITFPGGNPLEVGVLVDPLSIIICNVVAFISFLIIVYSTEYMHGDQHLTRFWFFFLFFIGNMLLLVLSNNLLQTMVGWEGVGICSWGLIGYYYRDAKERWLGGPPPHKMFPPSHAGMKAFVVTGIGDVFILGAIFIIFNFAGTLNYVELIETAHHWLPQIAAVPGLLAITAIFFLGGPIGKSAQFPLHEWLPEAMAGPTSVSALIHAATMVKAGVYLVARMSPIFYLGTWEMHIPEAQIYFIVIACVGAFTCFMAASQALVSVELKKILAYSTVSQIGYMMLALGVSGLSEGAYVAGLTASIFHLASHALFKAALFLGAGSVIHTIHTIYTFNMGGMKKYMPITFALMTIATASLAGIPPLSGFWSKDAVFIACLVANTPLSMTLLAVGAISAAMTFFYSIRYIKVTFLGQESHQDHVGAHRHPRRPRLRRRAIRPDRVLRAQLIPRALHRASAPRDAPPHGDNPTHPPPRVLNHPAGVEPFRRHAPDRWSLGLDVLPLKEGGLLGVRVRQYHPQTDPHLPLQPMVHELDLLRHLRLRPHRLRAGDVRHFGELVLRQDLWICQRGCCRLREGTLRLPG